MTTTENWCNKLTSELTSLSNALQNINTNQKESTEKLASDLTTLKNTLQKLSTSSEQATEERTDITKRMKDLKEVTERLASELTTHKNMLSSLSTTTEEIKREKISTSTYNNTLNIIEETKTIQKRTTQEFCKEIVHLSESLDNITNTLQDTITRIAVIDKEQ